MSLSLARLLRFLPRRHAVTTTPESISTPLGGLTYVQMSRQIDVDVKLEDGVKRARERQYHKPKERA